MDSKSVDERVRFPHGLLHATRIDMPSNAYMRAYMKARYHERRALALKVLGGRCALCSSKRLLQVDHKDPRKKTMNFTHMRSVGLAKFMKELAVCQLLCKPCHEKKTRVDMGHAPIGAHGTCAMYRRGCRCSECYAAKSDSQRRWSMKHRAKVLAAQANQVEAPL